MNGQDKSNLSSERFFCDLKYYRQKEEEDQASLVQLQLENGFMFSICLLTSGK